MERFEDYTTTQLLSFIREQENNVRSGAGVRRAERDLRWAWHELDDRMSTGAELPEQWRIGRKPEERS